MFFWFILGVEVVAEVFSVYVLVKLGQRKYGLKVSQGYKILILSHLHHGAGGLGGRPYDFQGDTLLQPQCNLEHADWSVI